MNNKIKRNGMLVLFLITILCGGCSSNATSKNGGTQTENMEASAMPVVAEGTDTKQYDAKEKLSHTTGYMLYDDTEQYVSVRYGLEGVSKFEQYDSVKCYMDEKLVTDNTTVENISSKYVLHFKINEYIEGFNRIEVGYKGQYEMIDIGECKIERYIEDEVSSKNKMELVGYENEDLINTFEGKFQIEGDRDQYELQYYVSKELSELGDVNISSEDANGTFNIRCECSMDSLVSKDLYSVEFDLYILQVNKKTGEKSIVCKCFIPLCRK